MPPTAQLPNIRVIPTLLNCQIKDSLDYLRLLYNPEVRGSRRRTSKIIPSSHEQSAAALKAFRADDFERSYAIRWLTSLIAHLSTQDGTGTSTPVEAQTDTLLENASALLALCSGPAGAGIFTRDVVLPTQCDSSITIRLRDVPLDNSDYRSVGAQTWGGACVLAELLVEEPMKFDLTFDTFQSGIRILELGAGTGLVSLAVTKTIERICTTTARQTDSMPHSITKVVATDYYPSVLENLASNIRSN